MNKFFSNFRKPEGFSGRLLLASMNIGHSAVSNWALKRLAIRPRDIILEIMAEGKSRLCVSAKRG